MMIKLRNYIKVLRQATAFCLILTILVSALAVNAWAATFAGGTGTETDPFLISTASQLASFAQTVNNGTNYAGLYIKLTQDIQLNSMNANGTFTSKNPSEFTRIGTSATKSFMGNFNGDGHKLIGMYIDQSNAMYEGLFGYAGTGSVIRNVYLSGSVSGGQNTGAIVGYTNGVVDGCVSTCAVTANWQPYHGGVAGYADTASIIRNCGVTATIEGAAYTGGITGYTNGQVTSCAVLVTVLNANSENHGGITGYADTNSRISGCTASGTVKGGNCVGGIAGLTVANIDGCSTTSLTVSGQTKVGCIAGSAQGTGVILSNCQVSGTATSNGDNVGGVAGWTNGTITNCNVTVSVTGQQSNIGGVVGYLADPTSKVTNCTATITATNAGNGPVGGIAGLSEGEISSCIVGGTVSGTNSYIGGVVGYSFRAASKVISCTVNCTVIANAGYGYIGGIAGQTDGEIILCTVNGTVTGTGQHYVGGVVGNATQSSDVTKCITTGQITGLGIVGGIAGYTNGDLSICINTGDVVGGSDGRAGGIVGKTGSGAEVSHSFNSGEVSGSGPGCIGGIIGYVDSNSVIHNNLNTGEVGGNQYVGCVTGNTLNENNAWKNYYLDYAGSPEGTTSGDVENADGAVPVGSLTWDEVWDLLNEDHGQVVDIWEPDIGDDGIPKPTIMPSLVKATQVKIKEGKYFTAAELGAVESASVTSDSVFTVCYSIKYTGACDLSSQTIGLSKGGQDTNLPANTSIIMLAGGQYYYRNLTSAESKVTLGSFMKMGSDSAVYTGGQAVSDNVKDYLFVFDFTRTAGELAAGTYKVQMSDAEGKNSGTMPTITMAGLNSYALTTTGGTNGFTVKLGKNMLTGYDYKTFGAFYAYEITIKKEGVTDVTWPTGTRINNSSVSTASRYFFTQEANGNVSNLIINMTDCASPLESGSYVVYINVYAASDVNNPRGGYLLTSGHTPVTINAPVKYGIKADTDDKFIDSSTSAIPVVFNIQTLGSTTVKSTLQRKYGLSYSDVAGEIDRPVSISGGTASLSIPAGSPKGTYRFVFSLYDSNNYLVMQTVENIIIK